MVTRLLIALVAWLLPVSVMAQPPATILISIDGFRPDYLNRGITPRLSALAADGVSSAMQPSFPSSTFPNHYTLVTGLRPDRHGIIANTMEDSRRPGETFTMATSDPFWWREAEPIWITAERAGIRAATMFWPGSNVGIGNVRPSDWWQYHQDIDEPQRVDAIIDWLRRPPATRPQFLTLYFDTVDTAGHDHGLDSTETNAAIAAVDAQVGRLVDGLAALGQRVNLIIVADHGMAATSPDRVIPLWKIANPRHFRAITHGAVAGIEPQKPKHEAILAKRLLVQHPHMQCARKADLSPSLQYGTHARVPRFVCIAEPGWLIRPAPPPLDKPMKAGGAHGYDPATADMAALFIAQGPAFRAGITLPPFQNVDIYPLLASLIGVAPRPGDGTAKTFDAALKP